MEGMTRRRTENLCNARCAVSQPRKRRTASRSSKSYDASRRKLRSVSNVSYHKESIPLRQTYNEACATQQLTMPSNPRGCVARRVIITLALLAVAHGQTPSTCSTTVDKAPTSTGSSVALATYPSLPNASQTSTSRRMLAIQYNTQPPVPHSYIMLPVVCTLPTVCLLVGSTRPSVTQTVCRHSHTGWFSQAALAHRLARCTEAAVSQQKR